MGLDDVVDAIADVMFHLVFLLYHGVVVQMILVNWCNVQFMDLFL